jgi:hypothetical protein
VVRYSREERTQDDGANAFPAAAATGATSSPVVTWAKNILVVANLTAMSDELFAALRARAEEGSSAFTLVVPAARSTTGRAAAEQRLSATIERLRAVGLEVDGRVAGGDPVGVVIEAWDPGRYDEIIVSTLPMSTSRWLHIGLPQRIAELTGALVTHVVCKAVRPPVDAVHVEPRTDGITGPLAPLRALGAIERSGKGLPRASR